MPSELGSYLQRHREELGLTLADLEARTRIRRRILEAIENGDWDQLPPSVYIRGLIRNYAKAIGVSPAAAHRMYVKERPTEARVPEPQLLSQPLVQQPRLSFELVAALGLLAIAVALFGWMVSSVLLPQVRGSGLTANPLGTAMPAPTLPATATPSRPSSTPPPVSRAQPLADSDAGTASPMGAATLTPATGPAAATSSLSPARGRLELVVTATGDAWLMVRADGQPVFLDHLRQGESRRWTANERFRVRTGNAGGTAITLNGRPVPALGGNGEVVEREWRLLPDGNIEQSG